jgi:3-oxoacyl-[acyl-carrier protein] reductase
MSTSLSPNPATPASDAHPRPHVTADRPLAGRVALVTGASRGIGRAVAERLARDGAAVVVNYAARADRAADAVDAITRAGGRALAVRADISDAAQIRALFDETERAFGGVDIVVNNAGTAIFKPTADVTDAEFDAVFALNARGTFLSLREAARRIRPGGRIVNVSTGGTAGSGAGAGLYTGSKAAVEQFTQALAKELGPRGITVNSVLPGMTRTEGLIMPEAAIAHAVASTPLGRLGEPEDVAAVVAFLVGDDARWVTGQQIRASGGL